jgi:hypothetical protein
VTPEVGLLTAAIPYTELKTALGRVMSAILRYILSLAIFLKHRGNSQVTSDFRVYCCEYIDNIDSKNKSRFKAAFIYLSLQSRYGVN